MRVTQETLVKGLGTQQREVRVCDEKVEWLSPRASSLGASGSHLAVAHTESNPFWSHTCGSARIEVPRTAPRMCFCVACHSACFQAKSKGSTLTRAGSLTRHRSEVWVSELDCVRAWLLTRKESAIWFHFISFQLQMIVTGHNITKSSKATCRLSGKECGDPLVMPAAVVGADHGRTNCIFISLLR